MNCKDKRGVTLIELVVVIAIIAIGAVLLAPNIGAWLPNYRLRSATQEVVSLLRTAQMKAISTNREYQVSFNPGAGSFILQYHNSGTDWPNEGETQTLPKGITISGISFPSCPAPANSNNCAQFNPNSTSSTGSITLRNTKGTEKRISLTTSTGRVHVDK
jgi:prepilin-type N-terminal cleavage/methylation domain-containing protein